jgi:hypothetical protein
VAAGGGAASGGAGGLSGEELAVCKQLSIKPDDYKKTKAQREGGDV